MTRKKLLKSLVIAVFWAGLLFFLIKALGKFPSLEEWQQYWTADTAKAMFCFSLFFGVATALRTWRFGWLLRQISTISWKRISLAFPWLFLLGAITPFRLGEGYRAIWIQKHENDLIGHAIGYWFAERFSDLMLLCIFLIIGLGFAGRVGNYSDWLVSLVLGLGVVAYLCLWLFSGRFVNWSRTKSFIPILITNSASSFSYMRSLPVHLGVVGGTVLIWLAMATAFYSALAFLLGPNENSFVLAVAVLAAVNLAGLFSAAPGNLGSYQAAVVGIFLLYGLSSDEGLIVSVILQSAGLVTTLFLGIGAKILDLSIGKPLSSES